MDLTPQTIAQATFGVTRKGYDPDEVRRFLADAARALDAAHQQASTMEVRARSALAKLQEASQQAPSTTEQTEAISRTLLLAQRAADEARAEAASEADAVRAEAAAYADEVRAAADQEAAAALEEARSTATRMVETAQIESRRARDEEHLAAESAVQALLARREFLLADVESLEQHVVAHRERLRELSGSLSELAERVPGGLGDLRRPLLSAADTALPLDGTPNGVDGDRQDQVRFDVEQRSGAVS
jgi:DivIVA domain-containing protein